MLGIGNVLMRDDGAGVRAVELLQKRGLPDAIRLLDVGTTIYHTFGLLTESDKIIVLDAIRLDGAPGTVYQFSSDEFRAKTPRKASSHDIGILDALSMLSLSGGIMPEVIIIGVQPKDYSTWGEELSPEVTASLPSMADKAVALLKNWGAV